MSDSPADADALTCPLCGYDLRGLPEHRCPECGHAFDPAELRAARDERRGWFFEHSARWTYAFAWTTVLTFMPIRFWSRITPSHALARSRLFVWMLIWSVSAAAIASGGFVPALRERVLVRTMVGGSGRRSGDWLIIFDEAWRYDALGPSVATLVVIAAIWPFAVVAASTLFSITMRRAGIRSRHLWRCAAYALPTSLLTYAFGIVAVEYGHFDPYKSDWMNLQMSSAIESFGMNHSLVVFLVATVVGSTIQLAIAHRLYLRITHSIRQALLVSTMSWLGVLAVIVALGSIRHLWIQ